MSIKFVKITTGEELIGTVQDFPDYIIFTNVAKISTHYTFEDPPEQPKTRVDVWAPHANGLSFKISKSQCIFIEDAHPSLVEYYNTNFVPKIGTVK